MASVPAVLMGVVLALYVTSRTTLNIESFMGAIMAVGVAVSNAILLVSFGDRHRLEDQGWSRPRRPRRRLGEGAAPADPDDRLRHDLGHDPDVASASRKDPSRTPRSAGP